MEKLPKSNGLFGLIKVSVSTYKIIDGASIVFSILTAGISGAAAGARAAAGAGAKQSSSIVARVMARIWRYPNVIDPRTGRRIPFPTGNLQAVPKAQRVPWTPDHRRDFIREWQQRGYGTPRGGWDKYDIHHIQPRQLGGSNDFWNLVPVESGTHQREFNSFWREFIE
jgi:hypothetical protein